MNIKSSTRAYSDRKDNDFITKDSGVRTQSAMEMQKMGDDNVGDVLNRIADPQWVDPSKKLRAVGNKNLDKDAFMKLMLAQMKHQDPTNPMQAHEMASQLAAFTSVEQLQNLNSTMEGMKKAQAPMQQFETLNLIGKAVAGDSAQLSRAKGDTTHDFQFKLLKEAEDVTLKIKNPQGEVVRTFTMKQLKAGGNSIQWNGQDERGVEQPGGDYTLEVEAKDKMGNKVGSETQFEGVITGVNFTSEGPLLLVGNRTVKFSDVRKIVDPRLKNDDQKIEKNVSQDLKVSPKTQETVNKGSVQNEPMKGNLDQIAMARGMLNRVEKETGKELAP
jgi:flagellar basal-body rod modification protein FlgD